MSSKSSERVVLAGDPIFELQTDELDRTTSKAATTTPARELTTPHRSTRLDVIPVFDTSKPLKDAAAALARKVTTLQESARLGRNQSRQSTEPDEFEADASTNTVDDSPVTDSLERRLDQEELARYHKLMELRREMEERQQSGAARIEGPEDDLLQRLKEALEEWV